MTEAEKSARAWQGQVGLSDVSLLKRYIDDLQFPMYYIAGLPEMVSAMKTLLKDSGVKEDNVQAEEFSWFKMGLINLVNDPKRKKHILLMAIVLMIIAGAIAPAGAATSLYKAGVFSLKNPLVYLMVGLLIVIVVLKIKHGKFHKLMQKKK